jgi:hypothetical protein
MGIQWHEANERIPAIPVKSPERNTTALYTHQTPLLQDALVETNRVESPLLRLPGEIRNMIYEQVIGGHIIAPIFQTPKRVGRKGNFAHKVILRWSQMQDFTQYPDPKPASTLLSLTRVSKMLYTETRLLVFRTNTFRISSLSGFQDMWCRLGAEQKASIHEVQFYRCIAYTFQQYGHLSPFARRAESYAQAFKGLEGLEEVRLITCQPCQALCPAQRKWEEAKEWIQGCVGTRRLRIEVEDEDR